MQIHPTLVHKSDKSPSAPCAIGNSHKHSVEPPQPHHQAFDHQPTPSCNSETIQHILKAHITSQQKSTTMSTAARRRLMRDFKVGGGRRSGAHDQTSVLTKYKAHANGSSSWSFRISCSRQCYDLVGNPNVERRESNANPPSTGTQSSSVQQIHPSKTALSDSLCTSKNNTQINHPRSSSLATCSTQTYTPLANFAWISYKIGGVRHTMWRLS